MDARVKPANDDMGVAAALALWMPILRVRSQSRRMFLSF
jgi:hypothetical protein